MRSTSKHAGDQRLAALDQAGLGGGAAHVEGHQPVEPEPLGEIGGRQRARGRARFDHPHRIASGDLDADDAASSRA